MPEVVYFGLGCREVIPSEIALLGPRVFAVVDPFLATTPHFSDLRTTLELQGCEVEVFTAFTAELPTADVVQAAAICVAFAPDVVLGYGGGSALDAAKLVALLATHGGELRDYYGEGKVPGPVLPLVAVPTTSGTGSEVTPVAVISDRDEELKVGISSRYLVPRIAVVDPELAMGAPASVAAYAGIDAFVHAVESYTAADLPFSWTGPLPVFTGRNALTSALSLEAVSLIGGSLERAVNDPSDRDARSAMARGSLLAGMAFGPTGTHLSHAIQYPIGSLTKTPHGLGTGMMLPFVLQACLPHITDRLADIARALGINARDRSDDDLAQDAIDRIADLCLAIGLPTSLRELGITEVHLSRIGMLTMRVARLVAIAPLPVERSFVDDIIAAAFQGDRSLLSQPQKETS